MRKRPRPEDLMDRHWRGWHVPRHRRSLLWRAVLSIVLVTLVSLIAYYLHVTNETRVKRQAQEFLTDFLNSKVEIGRAELSLFGPLRIEDVKVWPHGGEQFAPIFEAEALVVHHEIRAILRGELKPRQIVALRPHLRLLEDPATGRWNGFAGGAGGGKRAEETDAPAPDMPEILLREARLEYFELVDGKPERRGGMTIAGRLTPQSDPWWFGFDLQSRGDRSGLGPKVRGAINLKNNSVWADMRNVPLNDDLFRVMPAWIREWRARHKLTGRVAFPSVSVTPNGYRIEVHPNNASMVVPSDQFSTSISGDWAPTWKLMRGVGLDSAGTITAMEDAMRPEPIRLEQVSGAVVFAAEDEDIRVEVDLAGRVESNSLLIEGVAHGYTADAPMKFRVRSSGLENLYLPPSPRWVPNLPPELREMYYAFKPTGAARVDVTVSRDTPGDPPTVRGVIELVDIAFTFWTFPYPVEDVTGRIVLGEKDGEGFAKLDRIRGTAPEGSVNRGVSLEINGNVQPLNADAGLSIVITGDKVRAEPKLVQAFPPHVKDSLNLLDAHNKRGYPEFYGDFVCRVTKPTGRGADWSTTLDFKLRDASAELAAFPYPLRNVKGMVKVDGSAVRIDAVMKREGAEIKLKGKIGTDEHRRMWPDLKVVATAVPIDKLLLDAVPEAQGKWLRRVGLQGKFDLAGRIFTNDDPAELPIDEQPEVALDMDLTLKDGTLWPTGGTFSVSDLSANLHLLNSKLELKKVTGKRGDATLTADGSIEWEKESAKLSLSLEGKDLLLDPALYELLPKAARTAWTQINPKGAVNARMNYVGTFTAKDEDRETMRVEIEPRGLDITLNAFPYKLGNMRGSVIVGPDGVELRDVKANHGDAIVTLNGAGNFGGAWELQFAGRDILIDDELLKAVPVPLAESLKTVEAKGVLHVDAQKFVYTPAKDPKAPGSTHFKATMVAEELSLDPGVEIRDAKLTAKLEGKTTAGKLDMLQGTVDSPALTLAGWNAKSLSANIKKPSGKNTAVIDTIRAQVAGGTLAGQLNLAFPEKESATYLMNLVLREADVRKLTANPGDITGAVTLSLAMEGPWDDISKRQGRGDAHVVGKQLAHVPLLLGMMQVTNLGLPVTGPFSEGNVKFSLLGEVASVEHIQLKATNMTVQGSGKLDFKAGKVDLLLISDSPNWARIPIMKQLLAGAHRELMQIRVLGTIKEPKVTAGAMHTITTTVDEVLQGDAKN